MRIEFALVEPTVSYEATAETQPAPSALDTLDIVGCAVAGCTFVFIASRHRQTVRDRHTAAVLKGIQPKLAVRSYVDTHSDLTHVHLSHACETDRLCFQIAAAGMPACRLLQFVLVPP